MKNKFSKTWNSSKKPSKQRKYQKNAPLHVKSKFAGSHLSKELREKHGKRSLSLRKGDKVKIMIGNFRGKTAKIERVDIKNSKAYATGIEIIKKDGTKILRPLNPSNLMIIELNLDDKRRIKGN